MSVPGNLYTPTIRKTRGGDYLIEQSLRFNDDDSAYLNRTPSTAGNRKTWTFSVWFKPSVNGATQHILNASADASNNTRIQYQSTGTIQYVHADGGAVTDQVQTNAVFRDPSAWYHLVVAVDTTEATAADRVKMWVNSTAQTFQTTNYPTLNFNTDVNSTDDHYLGVNRTSQYFDGLMALPILVDGAALDPTSFGEEDADGYWNPIEFTGATVANFVPSGTYAALIGDMTADGGLAASFDDDLTQLNSEGSKSTVGLSTSNCNVGKQFSASKKITQVCITGSTDRGYASGNYTGSLTIYLKSSNSGIGVSETTHDSVTFNNSNATNPKTLTGDGSSATYWWVEIQGATGELGLMAEVQMYEEATASYGTNGFALDFNNSSFFGQDVKQEFTAPSVAFTDSAYDTTNTTSYTFSSMDIGVADADRYVYACVGSSNAAVAVLTFQTVTIGGVSATLLGASNSDPTFNLQPYAIYVAKVPSGTTADVVVTLNSSPANCAVALYRAVGVGLGYVDLKSSNGSTSPHSVTVDVPANGFILAHGCKNSQANRVTYTGVTEQYDFGGESDMAIHGGLNTSAGGTSQTVTVATTSPSYFGLLAVTIPPAGDNSYIANNFTAADQLADTPTDSTANETGNFATLNPLEPDSNGTFSNGNLTYKGVSATYTGVRSTIPLFDYAYFEATIDQVSVSDGARICVGVASGDANLLTAFHVNAKATALGQDLVIYENAVSGTDYGAVWANGEVFTFAVRDDGAGNTNIWVGDLSSSTFLGGGNPITNTTPTMTYTGLTPGNLFAAFHCYTTTDIVTINFGQNGFTYTPPTGFKALATQNLPDPTIAKPSDYFNTVLYTGNGTAIASGGNPVTGVGFQPDLVWIKDRDAVSSQIWFDVIRGATNFIQSHVTNAENTLAESLTSFDTDGFTVGSNANVNNNTNNYVAWCWKANGAAVSNTDGTITSSVSVNTTSGFSIVSYTGNTTGTPTVGHGLGVAPDFLIFKDRDVATEWLVWHSSLANTEALELNSTAAKATGWTGHFNSTTPGASVITLGTSGSGQGRTNPNGNAMICYAWNEVEGFSKFGSYTGNGSTDGPFVWTGFRSRWILLKRTDSTGGWFLLDTARSPYNDGNFKYLYADTSAADATLTFDVVSNGFKPRGTAAAFNASGGTYIFAAYAEHPFQGDDGVTQARAR